MATEIHHESNGNPKQTEGEPLGEIKEELKKPADLCNNAGDVNGTVEKSGCESLAEKEEPVAKDGTTVQKSVVTSGGEDEEDENEPKDGDDYCGEEEEGEGEGEEDARDGDAGAYEDEDEEYVGDGEEDEEEDDESEPPSKRRK